MPTNRLQSLHVSPKAAQSKTVGSTRSRNRSVENTVRGDHTKGKRDKDRGHIVDAALELVEIIEDTIGDNNLVHWVCQEVKPRREEEMWGELADHRLLIYRLNSEPVRVVFPRYLLVVSRCPVECFHVPFREKLAFLLEISPTRHTKPIKSPVSVFFSPLGFQPLLLFVFVVFLNHLFKFIKYSVRRRPN